MTQQSDVINLTKAQKELTVVYFSSVTETTKRFVEKLNFKKTFRIPLRPSEDFLNVHEPYVLIVPTYGGGNDKSAVPKQVIKFLNDKNNRSHCLGVIAAGNINFGESYAIAGSIVAGKLKVPFLYSFELLGTKHDVERVITGLNDFWGNQENL